MRAKSKAQGQNYPFSEQTLLSHLLEQHGTVTVKMQEGYKYEPTSETPMKNEECLHLSGAQTGLLADSISVAVIRLVK